MMGATVNAQAKKDTTVIFKVGIHCPSCKAKLDKNMPFEKGVKNYKLNMQDSTVVFSFRTDKNSVEALRAAVERYDVKVLGLCDKDGKLIQCGKAKKCCQGANKETCSGKCGKAEKCCGKCGDKKEEGTCGGNCCSKGDKAEGCCKNKEK